MMLSDEEKKAIEWLKKADWFSARLYSPTILNLIEKQSKEIEELKEKYRIQKGLYETYGISKDKIKAKIEEIENEDKKYKNYLKDGRENFTPEYVWARPVLQSLLEKE